MHLQKVMKTNELQRTTRVIRRKREMSLSEKAKGLYLISGSEVTV